MAEEEHPPNWLARFRERVDRFPNLYKIENLTIEQISSLERLVTLEQTLQKTTTELELLGQDAAARREILREDAGARLRLLNRITWLVSGIVGADIVLLGVVVWASIWCLINPIHGCRGC